MELRKAEKSYGAAEHRTLFIPGVLKEVASRLKGFMVPFDDSPTAGALADASPSTPIWQHAEGLTHHSAEGFAFQYQNLFATIRNAVPILREKILMLSQAFCAGCSVRIFGSHQFGLSSVMSDIDMCVDLPEGASKSGTQLLCYLHDQLKY